MKSKEIHRLRDRNFFNYKKTKKWKGFFPFKLFGSKYTDVELYKCVDVLFFLNYYLSIGKDA